MEKKLRLLAVTLPLCVSLLLSACSGSEASAGTPEKKALEKQETAKMSSEPTKSRKTLTSFLSPKASGSTVFECDGITLDVSNTGKGYLMLRYQGSADKVALQITQPDKVTYTYTVFSHDDYEAFPFSGGDGSYKIEVLEHAYDTMYSLAISEQVEVSLESEFDPFLYPNQYVWFTKDSEATKLSVDLSDRSEDDLDYIGRVYSYVTENIDYDKEAAENTPANYVPDIDKTLASGKGICFDYASLMSAMLRAQSIPTRLQVGYSGEAYHAWISVWTEETGWIDKAIQFDGKSWVLMDPTLAANNNASSVKKYIGDGNNYLVKYSY